MKKILLTSSESYLLEQYIGYRYLCDKNNKENEDMYNYIKYNNKIKFSEYVYNQTNEIGLHYDKEIEQYVSPGIDYSITMSNERFELLIKLVKEYILESVEEDMGEDYIQEIKDVLSKLTSFYNEE